MDQLNHEAYLALRSGAEVIEADRYGEKVLRLADGTFLKLFRRKRLISSAAWYPYAQRFADNCLTLETRGIPCPSVIAVYRIPTIRRDAVWYRPLAGVTIRQLVAFGLSKDDSGRLRNAIKEFVDLLHDRGIYFRSLHLGNIVRTPDAGLGLIDVADITFRSAELGKMERARNCQHMLRRQEDAKWLSAIT